MKNVGRVIVGLFGLFTLAPAGSADAQSYNWTGFYLGANAGYASGSSGSSSELCTVPTSTCAVNVPLAHLTNNQWSPTLHPNGFSGGMQAGYNWQWKNWVIGAEMDMNSFVTADERSTQINALGFVPVTVR